MSTSNDRRPRERPLWFLAWAQGFQALSVAVFAVGLAFSGAASQDGTGLGLTLAARTLPTLLVALVGGVAADRWRRERVASICLLLVAATHAAVALSIPRFGLSWPTQLISLAAGFFAAFGAPSLYAILPSIVPAERNIRANGIVRTFRNASGVFGPVLAAAIANALGTGALFWTATASSLVAAMLVACIDAGAPTRGKRTGMLQDMRGIGGIVRKNTWLLIGVPFWALFLAVQAGAAGIVQPLHVIGEAGGDTWSVMASCMAAGYIIGSLISVRLRLQAHLVAASILFGSMAAVQLLAVGLSSQVAIWYAASFLAGIGLEISGVLWGSALQTRISSEHIGRVSSLDYAVSFGLIPVGYAAFGAFSSSAAYAAVLLCSGLALLTLAALALLACRRFGVDVVNSEQRSDGGEA